MSVVVTGYGATAVVQELMSLADVADLAEGGAHYPLLMLTLQILNERLGRAALTDLFNESKVKSLILRPLINARNLLCSHLTSVVDFVFPGALKSSVCVLISSNP